MRSQISGLVILLLAPALAVAQSASPALLSGGSLASALHASEPERSEAEGYVLGVF